MVMLLEPIYECDFLPCSYGFRPGRSAHQAVARVRSAAMAMGGGWVLDVDIRKFFDTLDHGSLRGFLQRRVRDGVVRRLIDKWLKAGVLDGRALSYPKSGTPQGGVISPLLSNIYLHYVLDEWFEVVVSQTLQGRAELIRRRRRSWFGSSPRGAGAGADQARSTSSGSPFTGAEP